MTDEQIVKNHAEYFRRQRAGETDIDGRLSSGYDMSLITRRCKCPACLAAKRVRPADVPHLATRSCNALQ